MLSTIQVKGVGPSLAEELAKVGVASAKDLAEAEAAGHHCRLGDRREPCGQPDRGRPRRCSPPPEELQPSSAPEAKPAEKKRQAEAAEERSRKKEIRQKEEEEEIQGRESGRCFRQEIKAQEVGQRQKKEEKIISSDALPARIADPLHRREFQEAIAFSWDCRRSPPTRNCPPT